MLEITRQLNKRRLGVLKTKHGVIQTPFFMPDATRGFVKSVGRKDLEAIGLEPMVVNTYHLYLAPGISTIKKAGGINRFMNWDYPLLSDSGGYQIFSLIHKNPKLGKITDEGANFRSPLSGQAHFITPEKSIQIQFDLGVDMMVVLDDVPPHSYSKDKIARAVKRTIGWAERCMIEYKKQMKLRKIKESERPLIFCVIQGGTHLDLREYCAQELIKIESSTEGGPARNWDGYGFGARHIDAQGNLLEEMVRHTAELIPPRALRFALGVGTPGDIVRFSNFGWDMFDCVIPTREGRHGRLFISNKQAEIKMQNSKIKIKEELFYKTININNGKFKDDFSPVDSHCDCELCQNYSKSYLRHLFAVGDSLAQRLASVHNLKFYLDLMKKLQKNN